MTLKTVNGVLVAIALVFILAFLMLPMSFRAELSTLIRAGLIAEALWAIAFVLVYGLDPTLGFLHIPLLAWVVGAFLGGLITRHWSRGASAGFVASFVTVAFLIALPASIGISIGDIIVTNQFTIVAILCATLATTAGALGGLATWLRLKDIKSNKMVPKHPTQ